MDTMGVGVTLGLVNGAIDAAKKAVGIAKDLNSIELKEQVGDVLNSILDLKVRLLDLDEENRQLKMQLEAKTNQREVDSDDLLHLKVKMRGATDIIRAAGTVDAIHYFFYNHKSYLHSEFISAFLAKYPDNFRDLATYGQLFPDGEEEGFAQLKRDVEGLELPL